MGIKEGEVVMLLRLERYEEFRDSECGMKGERGREPDEVLTVAGCGVGGPLSSTTALLPWGAFWSDCI